MTACVLCLAFCFFACLSICLYVCPCRESIFVIELNLSLCFSICLPMYVTFCLPTYPCYVCLQLSVNLSILLPAPIWGVFLLYTVRMSLCVRLLHCLTFFCLSVSQSSFLFVCLIVRLLSVCLIVRLSVCLPDCEIVCLLVCLSVCLPDYKTVCLSSTL